MVSINSINVIFYIRIVSNISKFHKILIDENISRIFLLQNILGVNVYYAPYNLFCIPSHD